jgi:hypothetical protein
LFYYLNNSLSSLTIYIDYISWLNFWDTNFFLFFLCLGLLHYTLLSKMSKVVVYLLLVDLTHTTHLNIQQLVIRLILPSLWVGTITLHPLFLYISLVVLLFFLTSYYDRVKCIYLTKKFFCYVSFIALCLGSLWATQSLSWGYFWVNDSIEWLLFFICYFSFISIHIILYNNKLLFRHYNYLLVITVLLLIRLNFIVTRHSFLTSYWLSFSYLYIYLYIIAWQFCDIKTKTYNIANLVILFFIQKFCYLSAILKIVIIVITFYSSKYLIRVYKATYVTLHFYIFLFFFTWIVYFNNLVTMFNFLYSGQIIYIFYIQEYVVNLERLIYSNLDSIIESVSFFNFYNYYLSTFIDSYFNYRVFLENHIFYLVVIFSIFSNFYKKY